MKPFISGDTSDGKIARLVEGLGYETMTFNFSVDGKGSEGVWREGMKAADVVICYLPSEEKIGLFEHHQVAYLLEKPIVTIAKEEDKDRLHPYIKEVSNELIYLSRSELIVWEQLKRDLRLSLGAIETNMEGANSPSKERR